ncbi:BnaCnng78670D, partial [Brassica napus]
MASSATIDSQQPLPHSPFAALRLGRSSQSIHARLLRFWDSSNFSNPNEFKGITLLFLDEKDSMINGIIHAEQANHYRRSLQEGDIYRVAHFEVGICPHMYKSTEHTFLIRFLEETTIDSIINNCPHISLQKFMVRNYEQLQILANTNLELPDVVGQIQTVKGYDLKNAEVISPLLIRLRIAPNIEVDVSLWDTAAATFKACGPRKNRRQLYLSSTPATRCFFSPTLQAITDFTMSLRGAVTNLDDNTENATWPLSSIGDLSYFLSNPTDQEPYFVCKARIVDVLGQHGWYYVCCTQCSKEMVKSAASLRCDQCGNTNDKGHTDTSYKPQMENMKKSVLSLSDRESIKNTFS